MDWIEGYMAFTEGQPTPERFRLWSGIAAIGAALERRVWTVTASKKTFPNLFVLLVGPPTSGKTVAIDIAYEFWRDTKCYQFAPKSVSSAAVIDSLRDAGRTQMIGGQLVEYHSLIVPCPEFGTFMNAHDLGMMANVNDIWDCPSVFGQKRRTVNGGKTMEIINPQLNILGGAQPGFLASILPDEAWSMGFTSRLILVYGQEAPLVSLFNGVTYDPTARKRLLDGMARMSKAYGQFKWEAAAAHAIESWYAKRMEPIPMHAKLQNYNGRRILQFLKLIMVATIARTHEDIQLVISLDDIERARHWLLDAESLMPDVFREMKGKSDFDVLKDLHYAMWGVYVAKKKHPINSEFMHSFLAERVPSEKIDRIIETAEKTGMISRMAGTEMYIPKALSTYGPQD